MKEKIKEIGVFELLGEGVDRFLYVLASSKTVPMPNIKNAQPLVEGAILIGDNTFEFANSSLYFTIEKKSCFFVIVFGSTKNFLPADLLN